MTDLATPESMRSVAEQFLRMLDASPDATFCFRAIAPKGVDARKVGGNKNFTGTLAEHWAELERRNAAKQGIFVVINEGGHSAADIKVVRAVYLDLDEDGDAKAAVVRQWCNDTGFQPHAVVQSSPSKYHIYWKMADLAVTEFTEFQKALITKFGGDNSVHDLSRVMRLPGTLHTKTGTPSLVSIAAFSDAAPHEAGQLRAALTPAALPMPVEPSEPTEAAPIVPVAFEPLAGTGAVLAVPFDPAAAMKAAEATAVADAADALRFLNAADTYTWLNVRAALKLYGDEGWRVLNNWSQTAPTKYNLNDNWQSWLSATPLDGGLRPLFAAAQANGWDNRRAASPIAIQSAHNEQKEFFGKMDDMDSVLVEWLIDEMVPVDALAAISRP